ncbi:Hypothetical protein A7982_04329 [Minicystis rosea]|nr:Hypothetical protein A7982_04329 [Minicystis rosea]
MSNFFLVVKLGIGLVGAIATAYLASSKRLQQLSDGRFTLAAVTGGAAVRLAIFVGVFIVAGFAPQSDVMGWYYPQAKEALLGHVPYRDFASSYAPLFPYLESLALRVWDSPKSIVLLSILAEIASLPLWLRVARDALGERDARVAMTIYLCSPLPLVNAAIVGQNQAICSPFLALSLLLAFRGRALLSGLVLGVPLVALKFLTVLFLPPSFAASSRKTAWIAGAAALPVLVYGALVLAGVDVLTPFRSEAAVRTSGNLAFLLSAAGHGLSESTFHPTGGAGRVFIAWLAAGLVLVTLWRVRFRGTERPDATLHFTALLLLTFMLLSKKAYSSYLVMAFFPICVGVVSWARTPLARFGFGVVCTIALVEPSLWHTWIAPHDLGVIWNARAAGIPASKLAVFTLCEVVLVGAYVACWARTLGVLREMPVTGRALPPLFAPRAEPASAHREGAVSSKI